jgi:hypothetical protein
MWRVAAFLILTPIYVATAWAIYLGGKIVAAFIVESPIDQAAMALIAAAIAAGLGIALLSTRWERE